MAFVATKVFYKAPAYTEQAIEGSIPGVNVSADDADAYAAGWLRLWEDTPDRPGPFYDLVQGAMVENPGTSPPRLEKANLWQEWPYQQQRDQLRTDINIQVRTADVQTLVRDPEIEKDISRELAAASDKQQELDETADADLQTFDAALDVTPPQNGKGYARFTMSIIELAPFAGQPNDIYGLAATLDIQTDYEDQGVEARIQIIDSPKGSYVSGPLTQDPDDPRTWTWETADGFKWDDPDLSCRAQLLWGVGSLPTGPALTSEKLHDRKSQVVRYGVASSRRRNP